MTKPQMPHSGLVRYCLNQVYRLSGIFAVALILVTTLAINFGSNHVSAATSATLNFQARLESNTGAIAPDGNYNIQFKLYSVSSGGSALWTETYQNSASQGITVTNGYITANLGSITSFPSTINWDQDLYLTMNIGGTGSGGSPTYDGEMTPRLKLTAVPYAFRAGQLATYNGATTYTSTLSILAPTGGNQTFQIPDQGAAGTYSLLTTNTANNSFIQLQATTPGTAQTGNFNISGTGIANLLQAANIDTASAGTLGIGNTNATTINIGTNAAAHTIAIGNGAAAQAITIGSTNTTSALTLQAGSGGITINGSTTTNGFLTFTGTTTTTYLTPQGSSVPTKINIQSYDPGAFGQVVAMGIPSTAANTARVLSIFDARDASGGPHQPSIALFSPNENDAFGLSWDGSNSNAFIKTLGANSTISLRPGSANQLSLTAFQGGDVRVGATTDQNPSDLGAILQVQNDLTVASVAGNGTAGKTAISAYGQTGGNTSGTTGQTAGAGGGFLLQGGAGGTAATGSTNGNGGTLTFQGGAPGAGTGTAGSYGNINLQASGGNVGIGTASPTAKLTVVGTALFQTTSATAFQIQNGSGDNVFSVDTNTPGVLLGKASTITGQISYYNATNANTATIKSGVTTTSYTSLLPAAAGSAGQCLGVSSVAGSVQTLGYVSCALASGAGYVTLQGSTPGTADTGSFNITGTGIAGILKAGQLTVTGTSNQAQLIVKGYSTQTTDILQVTNSSGVVLSAFDQNGQLVLGTRTTSGTLVQGVLTLQDGSVGGFAATLKTATYTGNRNILLPDESGTVCLILSANCGFLTGSAASGVYVQLQATTPGTAQTGNLNISGTAIAATLQAPALSITNQATIQNTTDNTSELRVLNAAGGYLLNVNASNGYVINNGTKNIGNEVQNPSFESGGTVTGGEQGWTGPAQASIVNSSSNANSGNYELQVTPNGTSLTTLTAQYMSVNVGDVIYAEGWVKNSAGANGTGGLYLEAYDKDKASVSTTTDAASLPGTTYVLRKVTYTVPSGVKFVRVGAVVNSGATTGTYYFDDFYVRGSVAAPAVFKNSVDSTTAFLIQSASAAQTLFTADTTNNILKVGDSTGTDTATTIFVLDSTTANPTTSLSSKNGGLFYRSDTGALKAIIGGAVVDICTTASTCAGYSASATSSINLQASSPGSQQTGNFNISGTGILSQLQTSDTSTASSNSTTLVIRSGNATGTTSNSGGLTLDVGTATGTLGQITIGHTNVATVMPGTLDVQGANSLKLGTSSSADGSILFRNSVGGNTVTLKAAAANPGSSITLTLPTSLGSAGYCLKDTGSGALGFGDCGVGATVTMQNVYDNSSPASILLANSKDFTLTAQDTGTDPNILFNLQCVTSCSTNGRFAVQNGGTDVFTISPNSGGIVLGVATQIGSGTTNGTQTNLQLDSSSTFSDSGTCTTTAFQGAMYYNTASQSIRTCQDGSWSDVLTTRDLGLLMFGVVPDSGSSNQGDLPALVTSGVSGPCKVSWNSANSIHVEACVAYSGGRRVSVASTNITVTGLTTTNIWTNVCLTGTSNQPALSTTAAATETSSTSGFFPTFSISAPVLCLAQIKGSTSTANNIAQIYDVRTFSTTQKLPMLASTALSLGMLADVNPSTAVPSVSGSRRMIGTVVATNGSTSSTSPNVILTTFGPAWVKATAGTAGDFVIQSATNGYTATNNTIPNNSFNYEVGITPTAFSSTCSAASNCSGSLFVNFQVR